MTPLQIARANIEDLKSMEAAAHSFIQYAVNIGERLEQAKSQVDDFPAWVENTHPFKIVQARRYIRIAAHKAQAIAHVKNGEASSIAEVVKLLPPVDSAPEPAPVETTTLAYVGRKPGEAARDADDWHTPAPYVDAARKVMGSIDLDPFSSVEANAVVGAKRILTAAEDALACDWASPKTRTCWMNPPYSRGLSSKAVEKFIEQYDYGAFDQAVVLMNASTDTAWFHRMSGVASALCLTRGRISFVGAGNKVASGNTKGQVFFYAGKNVDKFSKVFGEFGLVLMTGVI